MYAKHRKVLLVGGVPGDSAEDVFRLCAPIVGDLAEGLTDGETGFRYLWVVFLAPQVFAVHPDVEIANRPKPKPGVEDWIPGGWEDLWRFRLKPGVDSISFPRLGYADFAKASYAKFCELRDKGVIAKDTRYQVCIPFPEDCTRWCTTNPRDFEIMTRGVEEALAREIGEIVAHIPSRDLVMQWDICWEVFAYVTGDYLGKDPLPWKANGNPFERYVGYIRRLSPLVPVDAELGLHLCWGDLGHEHLVQPKDLADGVRMANAGVREAGRRVDFVHLPVPRDRSDDKYFEPLEDLAIGQTKLFIGLIHYTDGKEGSMKRLETFRRHYRGPFGVATECGFARRPRDQRIDRLLAIHRDLAAAI